MMAIHNRIAELEQIRENQRLVLTGLREQLAHKDRVIEALANLHHERDKDEVESGLWDALDDTLDYIKWAEAKTEAEGEAEKLREMIRDARPRLNYHVSKGDAAIKHVAESMDKAIMDLNQGMVIDNEE